MAGPRPDTWMPFYIGDYLRDTGRLTTECHGAYILLIFDYWTSGGPLPDDDVQLAAITKLSMHSWRKIRKILEQFFENRDGFWHHGRIDYELEVAKGITNVRSTAGKAGASARWGTRDVGEQAQEDDDNRSGKDGGKQHGKRIANACAGLWQNDAPSPSQKKVRKKEGRIPPHPPNAAEGENPKPTAPETPPAVTSPTTGEGEAPQPGDKPPKPPPPDHAPEMFAIWRERFGAGWPKLFLDDKRAKALNTRLRDSFGKDIAKWAEFCDLVLANPFLTGKMPGKPWRADLDWITGPTHIQAIREGKYDYELAEGYPTHANGSAITRRIPHETLLTGFAEAARDHRNKAKV